MEFEFRAWDRTTHKDGVMVPWKDLKGFKCEVIFLPLSEVELMQYTGHKDKNGTKIFLGDIIEYNTKLESGVAEVVYFGNSNSIALQWISQETPSPSIIGSMFYFGCSKELKVLGNRYENPELLE